MAFLMLKEVNPNIKLFFNKQSRTHIHFQGEISFSPSEISVGLGQLRPGASSQAQTDCKYQHKPCYNSILLNPGSEFFILLLQHGDFFFQF